MAIKTLYPKKRTFSSTTEYKMFRRVKGNRSVEETRIKKIRTSIMENGYICNPIIVNERMEVIDGQGRLEVLKELGLPVDYIVVPGTGAKECTAMNIASTNWTMMDYINSYAVTGNQNYINLKKLVEKYKGVAGLSVITGLVMGNPGARGNTARNAVMKGQYICGVNEMSYAQRRLDWLATMKPVFKTCANKTTLHVCLLYAYDMREVDRERLATQILEFGKVTGFSTIEDCFDVLSEIYNFRLRAENKIDFKHCYKYEMVKADYKKPNDWIV